MTRKRITILLLLTFFSLRPIYASRDSDGEFSKAWEIGDPYHELAIEIPTENGPIKSAMSKIYFTNLNEITSSYRVMNECDSTEKIKTALVIPLSSELRDYGLISFKKNRFAIYRYDIERGCIFPNTNITSDEFVQQLENETRMMVDRIKLYFEMRNYFFYSIEEIGDSKMWNKLAQDYNSFTESVTSDLGKIRVRPYVNRTGVQTLLKINNSFSFSQQAREMIKELDTFDLTVLDRKLSSLNLAKQVLTEKFELENIRALKRKIRRYPSKHPIRAKLRLQLEALYTKYGYKDESFVDDILAL